MRFVNSNTGLPVEYVANKKRIPLTEKKQVIKSGIIGSSGTIDVPNDVRRVLMEHFETTELSEEEPDEQMLEVLEDLYVKAGEIGWYFFIAPW